jgi:hypothetical protein
MSLRRNAVLGTIRGYDFAQIEPFARSLRRASPATELVLFHNSLDRASRQRLAEDGATLIPIRYNGYGAENRWSRVWPLLRTIANLPVGNHLRKIAYRQVLNIATVRFVCALDFLEQNRSHYDHVLLSDVADVIFQANPFSEHLDGPIVAFLEAPHLIFGSEPRFNDVWIQNIYDADTLSRLSGHRISCCGTVLGSVDGIILYLRAFLEEIRKLRSLAWGADTAIHNVIIREVLNDKVHIAENMEGAVGTLGNESPERLNKSPEGLVRSRSNKIVPILHQYTPEIGRDVLLAQGLSATEFRLDSRCLQ